MPENLTPTTALEAVNAILASIGESPVASLGTGGFVDAELAYNLLIEESRRVQSQGWSFNTETEVELFPTLTGEIYLDPNVMRFKYSDATLVQRGQRVYDTTTRSYTTFTTSITGVTLVVGLDYDHLPEDLRQFLYIRAGRRFQDKAAGDTTLHQFQARDEMAAWASFINYEADVGQYNVLTNDKVIQRIRQNR